MAELLCRSMAQAIHKRFVILSFNCHFVVLIVMRWLPPLWDCCSVFLLSVCPFVVILSFCLCCGDCLGRLDLHDCSQVQRYTFTPGYCLRARFVGCFFFAFCFCSCSLGLLFSFRALFSGCTQFAAAHTTATAQKLYASAKQNLTCSKCRASPIIYHLSKRMTVSLRALPGSYSHQASAHLACIKVALQLCHGVMWLNKSMHSPEHQVAIFCNQLGIVGPC